MKPSSTAIYLGGGIGLLLFIFTYAMVLPRSLRPEAELLLPAYASMVGGVAAALLYLAISQLVPSLKPKPRILLERKGQTTHAREAGETLSGRGKLALTYLAVTVLAIYILTSYAALGGMVQLPRGIGFPTLIPVQGESMMPTIHSGDAALIWVNPGNVKPGEIIVFKHPEEPGKTVIHRVLERKLDEKGRAYLITKGDANPTADPWRVMERDVAARYLNFRIPLLGSLQAALSSPGGLAAVIIALVVTPLILQTLLDLRRLQTPPLKKEATVEGLKPKRCIFVEEWSCKVEGETAPLEVCRLCMKARLEWERLRKAAA